MESDLGHELRIIVLNLHIAALMACRFSQLYSCKNVSAGCTGSVSHAYISNRVTVDCLLFQALSEELGRPILRTIRWGVVHTAQEGGAKEDPVTRAFGARVAKTLNYLRQLA